jgi:hypothetical protein
VDTTELCEISRATSEISYWAEDDFDVRESLIPSPANARDLPVSAFCRLRVYCFHEVDSDVWIPPILLRLLRRISYS